MRKCKNCHQPFEPKFNSLEKYCWLPDCKSIEAMDKLAKIKRTESAEWERQRKAIRERLKSSSNWKQDVQKLFNEFIRLRDKKQPCISCGKPLGQKFDAGHFYSVGSYPNLRFHEHNVHGQCVHCNRDKHGNVHEYRIGLEKRIGPDLVKQLDDQRNVPRKYTIDELKIMIAMLKSKIKLLK